MNLNETLALFYFVSKTLAVIAGIGCLAALMADTFDLPFKKKIRPLLLGSTFLTATAYFFSTSYVSQETCFVDKKGNVAASFPHKTVLWAWNYYRLSQGTELLSYACKEVEVDWMNPIPKATNTIFIHMTLIVEKIPLPETAAKYYRELASVPSDVGGKAAEENKFKRVARTALIAFSEREGEKISKFDNSLDDTQQQSFDGLVRRSLNPLLLEKGMRVKHAEFEIDL